MARTTHTSDHEPLYARVATQLLGELRDGSVPPGERLPAERELANRFGVSRETVRQALQLLRRSGQVSTDRRGSHATLSGGPPNPYRPSISLSERTPVSPARAAGPR